MQIDQLLLNRENLSLFPCLKKVSAPYISNCTLHWTFLLPLGKNFPFPFSFVQVNINLLPVDYWGAQWICCSLGPTLFIIPSEWDFILDNPSIFSCMLLHVWWSGHHLCTIAWCRLGPNNLQCVFTAMKEPLSVAHWCVFSFWTAVEL